MRLPQVPACPAQVRLSLITPLRLRVADQYIGPEQFSIAHLLRGLVRRISQLIAHHTDQPLAADFPALKAMAQTIEPLNAHLHWQELSRWSGRQQELLQSGGLLGGFTLDGAPLAPFWPYLWLGQHTHAGKNASMGLGRYRLDPA